MNIDLKKNHLMKKISVFCMLLLLSHFAKAQFKVQLSSNVSIGISRNIETYFFVEKLAVERINNFVFDIKGTDYSHQPIVYFGFKHFQQYQNDPIIMRAAELLKELRDSLHDNGPILEYLLNQKEFPSTGARFVDAKGKLNLNSGNAKLQPLLAELTDSLKKFYIRTDVSGFLKWNAAFYKGILNEVVKDVNRSSFHFMEKWYGKKFPQYELYVSPAMPITPGEDNYRGFAPRISSAKGKIPSMVVSSSRMLDLKTDLSQYQQFGFDNPSVNKFIFSHEVLHSFVNHLLDKYSTQIKGDSLLFTRNLKEMLAPSYINDWTVCVIEHLVRLGEIRIALSMNNHKEAERLRKIHIYEYKCVLIPLLEHKIKEYENDRIRYPTFESYLPELMDYLHSLSPQNIEDQIVKYKTLQFHQY